MLKDLFVFNQLKCNRAWFNNLPKLRASWKKRHFLPFWGSSLRNQYFTHPLNRMLKIKWHCYSSTAHRQTENQLQITAQKYKQWRSAKKHLLLGTVKFILYKRSRPLFIITYYIQYTLLIVGICSTYINTFRNMNTGTELSLLTKGSKRSKQLHTPFLKGSITDFLYKAAFSYELFVSVRMTSPIPRM